MGRSTMGGAEFGSAGGVIPIPPIPPTWPTGIYGVQGESAGTVDPRFTTVRDA